jgi:hypothetical protein
VKNAPQAQYSTQEQVEWLTAFYRAQNGCLCQPSTVPQLVQMANRAGLYDAADLVQRRAEGKTIRNRADLEALMVR